MIVGIIFLLMALGLFLIYMNTSNIKTIYSHNGKCQGTGSGASCQVSFTVAKTLQPPILVLYTLGNAYINHRKYIGSIDPLQLQGKAVSMTQAQSVCHPFVTNKEMQKNVSYTGTPLVPASIAYPCGFKSYLTFNDSFKLYDSAGTRVPIN